MTDKFIEIMGSIRFREELFLSLLYPFGILFCIWLISVLFKFWNRPEMTYGSRYPLVGKIRFWGAAILAGIFMVLALANPYIAKEGVSFSRGNADVIIVIDRSISMRADDIKESRLEIAKREALNIESLLNDGDKVALFIFGKESHRKIYLTERHPVVFERISRISFPSPGNLKGDGLIWDSDFGSMLENIYYSLDRQDSGDREYLKKGFIPSKKSNRIVILFTDGEDQLKNDRSVGAQDVQARIEYMKRLNKALKEFERRGIKIYPVGIGTRKGVSWPSLLKGYKEKDDFSEGLLMDWKGKISRLDRENLSFLAKSTGVDVNENVWTVENSSTSVRSYLRNIIDSNRSVVPQFGTGDEESQLWQYFLLIAVAIIIIGIVTYPYDGFLRKNKGA